MFGIFVTHVCDLVCERKASRAWRLEVPLRPRHACCSTGKDLPRTSGLHEVVPRTAGRGPQYGRWTYWEKFDYFAVFWGIAVIGSTGLMLWFPEFFTRLLPGWLINVATIIHSDEALLATGFIFTVHFFNTHLRPEKFPMDR